MGPSLKQLGEFGLIRHLTEKWRSLPSQLSVGVGDDAAIWQPSPGCETLLTSDLLVEGTHFSFKTTSSWQLGAKALAANISDIAAMGGLPRLFLLSIAFPKKKKFNLKFFSDFYDGAKAWGDSFGVHLAGGDFSATKDLLTINVTIVGEVEKGKSLRRTGAKPGNILCCTGYPGDSAAGLACLSATTRQKKIFDKDAKTLVEKKHLTPLPRVLAGRWLLAKRAATACIDISDGVSSEAKHLADQSGVGIEIDAASLPVSVSAAKIAKVLRKDPKDWVLGGGEDYELLFTVPSSKMRLVSDYLLHETGSHVWPIGRIVKRKGLRIRKGGKIKELQSYGYRHF